MTPAELRARLRAGTVTPEICQAAADGWVADEADKRRIIEERDLTFTLMLHRAEIAEAENARLREANGILEDGLQEVGDDYPGSSCQEWCQNQVAAARAITTTGATE